MNVAITAIFPSMQSAQAAAGCMAVCPDRSHSLQISTECCDHQAVTAASRLPGGYARHLLDITPTSACAAARSQSAILRIRCSDQLADFAARELASLGAEKITVTPLS